MLLKTSSAFFDSILCYAMSTILDLDGSSTRKDGGKVTRAASACYCVCTVVFWLRSWSPAASKKYVCFWRMGSEKGTVSNKMAFRRQAYMHRGGTRTKNL